MLTPLKNMFQKTKEVLKNDNGQGLVEYALILVLIAIVVLAAIGDLGKTTKNQFSVINSAIKN